MLARIEQVFFELAGGLVVAAVLLVALQSVRVPDLPPAAGAVAVLVVPLWALGRYAWARRGAHGRTPDRPKPRRRALPPPPTFENGNVHLPEGRTPRRPS